MPILQSWNEIREVAAGAVKKRTVEGRSADLVRIDVAAGARVDRHTHPHEQFVQVVAGRGTLETAEGRRIFSAESVFHFPAETWHAARFDEDTILIETNVRA